MLRACFAPWALCLWHKAGVGNGIGAAGDEGGDNDGFDSSDNTLHFDGMCPCRYYPNAYQYKHWVAPMCQVARRSAIFLGAKL